MDQERRQKQMRDDTFWEDRTNGGTVIDWARDRSYNGGASRGTLKMKSRHSKLWIRLETDRSVISVTWIISLLQHPSHNNSKPFAYPRLKRRGLFSWEIEKEPPCQLYLGSTLFLSDHSKIKLINSKAHLLFPFLQKSSNLFLEPSSKICTLHQEFPEN